MTLQAYRKFIASRAVDTMHRGFDPLTINTAAKTHQTAALDFALRAGKAAMFLDTGLGKSFIELEFARQAVADPHAACRRRSDGPRGAEVRD